DDVDERPAYEDFIRAYWRREDAKLFELRVDQRIDVVVFGNIGWERVVEALGDDDDLGSDRERREASHDEGLAAFGGRDQAIGRDCGRVFVVAEEQRPFGHVPFGAVGVVSANRKLLAGAFALKQHLLRQDFQ